MIVEMRTYVFVAGGAPKFLKIYQEKGLAIQTRILGNLLGYFVTEVGPLDQTVHLWGYDSFEERVRRRSLLQSDGDWQAFFAEIAPLLVSQQSALLTPTTFSPIR
jgi:hypothetical protein